MVAQLMFSLLQKGLNVKYRYCDVKNTKAHVINNSNCPVSPVKPTFDNPFLCGID